jgi:hypothetical protein
VDPNALINLSEATPELVIKAIESFSITARGLQVEIGPSEVGMACQRCVCRKLAGIDKTQITGSWRAQLGTYVHAGLEEEFASRYSADQVITEQRLQIHDYKSLHLAGSCDAFFPRFGTGLGGLVGDWKIVGDDTLESVAKGNLKHQYFIQGQLYGLGWERLGFEVGDITIFFLPANRGNLSRDAVPISFRYDPTVAAVALAKIERYIDLAEEIGWEELLRRTPTEPGCLSCKSYEVHDNPVNDLLLRK